MGRLVKKVTHCNSKRNEKAEFVQISLFPELEEKRRRKGRRRKKVKETTAAQKRINRIRARRKFRAKLEANFSEGDYMAVLTYAERPTEEEAQKHLKMFFQRVRRAYKKRKLDNPKYMIVTEVGKRGGVHHHLVIDNSLDRDTLEEMWKQGFCNTRRLKKTKEGFKQIALYMTKRGTIDGGEAELEKFRKRWTCSKNLIEPWETYSDGPSSAKEKVLQEAPEDSEQIKYIFEHDHKGYELISFERSYCEITGKWYYYAEMRLRPPS